ncbi:MULTISPECIES: IclR family transcriptional regulator [Amycolatopsis]|uniref:DNA-binding transcriptional regulator, IclR family n=2 Tax=Amycolatopsis TaxID=1813 RepID=A0A1I3T256_9PSEU|nr:helix-turn-helix domain-containing protein [Amycolatopsis sacchari]SFJ63921.1 DNA-binding transcriptional regulator, IclR family [Amycolatopsis sacchari]
MTSGGGTGDIQAVHRLAEILRLFTLNKPQVTVAEAAASIGLNRTTLHRYFSSMVLDEILERAPGDATAYMPGRLLLQLGAVAQGQRRVLDVAPRHMDALSVETGLSVVLSLWGASGPVVSLVSEAGTHPILITVRIGSTLGPDSAQTRLFMALFRDEERVKRYLGGIPAEARAKLEGQLEACRARGLSRIAVPAIDGVVLAAAVFDEHDVAATVALVGTTSSLPEQAVDTEEALLRAARAITEELGGGDTRRAALTEPD